MAAPAPGRRQSMRHVRTSTTRPTNYYARTFSGRGGPVDDPSSSTNAAPGFYPAITHFTDAVDALPKEVMKHFSMLKEVDAKVYPQDKELRRIADEIGRLPPPPRSNLHIHEGHFPGLSLYNSVNGSRNASVQSFNSAQPPPAGSQSSASTQPDERRRLFAELNKTIMQLVPMLDEKIAVFNTANETLKSQLWRMESSYIHVPEEISPEARWGSTTHWAYVTDKETKKSGAGSRRDAAGANSLAAAAAQVEGEAALRSEQRREAMYAKKSRKHAMDSDFDDAPASRKVAKTKKAVAAGEEGRARVGLGITNGVGGPGKKRKNAAAQPMERAMSAALHGRLVSPRETPSAEGNRGRKKAAPGPAPKKRQPGGASPHLASSPLVGTFGPKDVGGSRPATSRGCQNSYSIGAAALAINRPSSSSSNRPPNGLRAGTVEAAAGDNEAMQVPTAREERPATEGPASRASLQPADATLKREDADNNEDVPMPETDTLVIREVVTRAGRTSKTATPLTATFPDFATARGRTTRTKESGNASHASSESGDRASIKEKRTGLRNGGTPSLLAERRKAAIEADGKDEDSLAQEDEQSEENDGGPGEDGDEEDGEDVDDNEPRYCYCNEVSYGEMVACDNEGCPREWFHLKCAGLREAPGENTKWYCRLCEGGMRKRKRMEEERESERERNGNGNGNGNGVGKKEGEGQVEK